MLTPSARVSVAKTTASRFSSKQASTISRKAGTIPAWCMARPPAQAVDEVGVLQGAQVVVGEVQESRLGDRLDVASFLGRGEHQSVAPTLVGRVVTGGPGEDEDDDRQEVLSFQGLEEFAASRRAKRRRRGAGLGSLPLRSGSELPGRLHQVVDAPGLVREARSVEEVDDLDVRLAATHDGQVVVQLDRALVLHDDRRRPAHLGEPLPDEVGVADRGREGDEAHRRRREDDDLLPHPAAKRVLEVVDLVEDDEAERTAAGATR